MNPVSVPYERNTRHPGGPDHGPGARGSLLTGESTLIDVMRAHAARTPQRRAGIFLEENGDETAALDYATFDLRARCVAAELQRRGAGGEPVLLLFPPGPDFIVAYLGCLYAGAVAVPTDMGRPNRPSGRLTGIARDSGAKYALTVAARSEAWRESPGLTEIEWIVTDQLAGELAEAWREPGLGPDDVAMLQYTSGSTGDPKGVMVSHGNLIANLIAIEHQMQHSPDCCMVSWLPHFHDMGLVGGMLQPLFVGFPTVLLPPLAFTKQPILWLQAISRYGGTTSGAPNFAYEHCVRRISDDSKAALDLSSWKVAYNGAEPVRAETLERFSEAFRSCGFRREAFFPCYGMAESTLLISGGSPPETARVREDPGKKDRHVSCGWSVPQHEIAIVDPETRSRQSAGRVGEVWFAGPSVATGYWKRPEESERTFGARVKDEDGVRHLRTGDLGYLREGELYLTGRLKSVIVIAGVNHHVEDIERAAERAHPWVCPGNCVAFGIAAGGEEEIVVAVEFDRQQWRALRKGPAAKNAPQGWRRLGLGRNAESADGEVSLEQIEASIGRGVSMELGVRIHAVVPVPPLSLPRTTSGKVKRDACRRTFLDGGWRSPKDPVGRPTSAPGRVDEVRA